MGARGKYSVWILLLGLVPAMFIGIYYGYHAEQAMEDKVLRMAESAVQDTALALNDRISFVERLMNTAALNESVGEMLYTLPEQDIIAQITTEKKIEKYFNSVVYYNKHVQSIFILPLHSQNQMYGHGAMGTDKKEYIDYFLGGEFEKTKVYQQVLAQKYKMMWKTITIEGVDYVCLIKNFNYYLLGYPLGVLVFITTPDMLKDFTTTDTLEINSQIWNVVDKVDVPKLTSMPTQEQVVTETDTTFSIIAPLRSGWVYQEEIYKNFLFDELSIVRRNMIHFFAITLLVFLGLSFMLSYWMKARVTTLVSKFKRLEKGDFQVETTLEGRDELGWIEHEYNKMVRQLKVTIDENYIYQVAKRRAELRVLQYQINPHFLYNALESINAMVSLGRTEQAKEMMQKLSEMYRYNMSSSNNELVPLREELTHVERYVYIQNIQLSGRLNLFFDLEESIAGLPVLRFLLQPIVENAIKHGFTDSQKNYSLEISGMIEDNKLLVTITDDGEGMTPQTLEELRLMLNTEKTAPESHGLGLVNVTQRVKLFYGEEYGVELQSKEHLGTTVVLKLSIKENVHDNSFGSR